ncbi:hypothetical protein [Methylobacterium sp. JK268]
MQIVHLYLLVPPLLAVVAAWLGARAIQRSAARIDADTARRKASHSAAE